MVGRVVDVVDTNGVEAEFLEVLDIALAVLGVGDGVFNLGRATLDTVSRVI